MIQNVDKQKIKLEQKKSRLIIEETRLRLRERKMRTRHLIELGGLIVKAGIDSLETDTLYGALLGVAKNLEADASLKTGWTAAGSARMIEEEQKYTPVIVKFELEVTQEVRNVLRCHGMRLNKFRNEWYANVVDLTGLKHDLSVVGTDIKYDLEVIGSIK